MNYLSDVCDAALVRNCFNRLRNTMLFNSLISVFNLIYNQNNNNICKENEDSREYRNDDNSQDNECKDYVSKITNVRLVRNVILDYAYNILDKYLVTRLFCALKKSSFNLLRDKIRSNSRELNKEVFIRSFKYETSVASLKYLKNCSLDFSDNNIKTNNTCNCDIRKKCYFEFKDLELPKSLSLVDNYQLNQLKIKSMGTEVNLNTEKSTNNKSISAFANIKNYNFIQQIHNLFNNKIKRTTYDQLLNTTNNDFLRNRLKVFINNKHQTSLKPYFSTLKKSAKTMIAKSFIKNLMKKYYLTSLIQVLKIVNRNEKYVNLIYIKLSHEKNNEYDNCKLVVSQWLSFTQRKRVFKQILEFVYKSHKKIYLEYLKELASDEENQISKNKDNKYNTSTCTSTIKRLIMNKAYEIYEDERIDETNLKEKLFVEKLCFRNKEYYEALIQEKINLRNKNINNNCYSTGSSLNNDNEVDERSNDDEVSYEVLNNSNDLSNDSMNIDYHNRESYLNDDRIKKEDYSG